MEKQLVEPEFGCPKCGERDQDVLLLDSDNDVVLCQRCNTRYDISGDVSFIITDSQS